MPGAASGAGEDGKSGCENAGCVGKGTLHIESPVVERKAAESGYALPGFIPPWSLDTRPGHSRTSRFPNFSKSRNPSVPNEALHAIGAEPLTVDSAIAS